RGARARSLAGPGRWRPRRGADYLRRRAARLGDRRERYPLARALALRPGLRLQALRHARRAAGLLVAAGEGRLEGLDGTEEAMSTEMPELSWAEFEKVWLCAGTVLKVEPFPEAQIGRAHV